MGTLPLVSVIIPVYNVESYLEQCLQSIINGTYKNLEIIIIDDGSTDKSGAICDQYKKRDGRIKAFHTENRGLSCARNEGLKVASGDFLSFIDSDDWVELDTYAVIVSKLIESCADIGVFGFYTVKDGAVKKISINKYMNNDHKLSSKEALNLLICDAELSSHACNKIYKREVFKNINFPEGKIFEDFYVMHKLFANADKIFVMGKCFKYYYRQRTGAITSSKTFETKKKYFDAFFYRYEDLKNNIQIDKTALLKIVFQGYINLFTKPPIVAIKAYKKSYKKFIKENKEAIDVKALNISGKLLLKLPLPLFMLLYNRLTRNIYKFIFNAKANSCKV